MVAAGSGRLPTFKAFREKALATLEAQYLEDLVARAEGDSKKALSISGLGKSRFYELLKKHKLSL